FHSAVFAPASRTSSCGEMLISSRRSGLLSCRTRSTASYSTSIGSHCGTGSDASDGRPSGRGYRPSDLGDESSRTQPIRIARSLTLDLVRVTEGVPRILATRSLLSKRILFLRSEGSTLWNTRYDAGGDRGRGARAGAGRRMGVPRRDRTPRRAGEAELMVPVRRSYKLASFPIQFEGWDATHSRVKSEPRGAGAVDPFRFHTESRL